MVVALVAGLGWMLQESVCTPSMPRASVVKVLTTLHAL